MPIRRPRRAWRSGCLAACVLVLLVGCEPGRSSSSEDTSSTSRATHSSRPAASGSGPHTSAHPADGSRTVVAPAFRHPLPGMPRAIGNSVYGATRKGMLRRDVGLDPAYLYVPDSIGTTTTVINQRTRKVVRVIRSGMLSQHVNPSYNLRTLYVDASGANSLVAINPRTARVERRFSVPRPYNLYFTPDGRTAVAMVEQYNEIRFLNPRTFRGHDVLTPRACDGPNHADFAANGRWFVVTCEFSGTLLKVSTTSHRVIGRLDLGATSMPQDIRISPDGTRFFVAEMGRNRVTMIDSSSLRLVGSIATPSMPHGLMPSRNGRLLYVSDRGAGKISVVSFARRKIVDTWTIPGGGSPDMGGVSASGRILWVSGRYDGEVYGFNTGTGRLVARIHVGGSPHGLLVWPQPGRYSLGHTGDMR